jgi:acetyl esterase/lipase
MGESAGGNLCAAVTLAAMRNGRAPLPDAAILLSPLLDFSYRSGTLETHAERDIAVTRAELDKIRRLYLRPEHHADPLASPLAADLAGFPPVQIFCGGHEILIGDSIEFARRLAEADCLVEAHFLPGMTHGWSFLSPQHALSRLTVRHVVRFIRQIAGPHG